MGLSPLTEYTPGEQFRYCCLGSSTASASSHVYNGYFIQKYLKSVMRKIFCKNRTFVNSPTLTDFHGSFSLMGILRWTTESSALLGNTGKYAQIYSRGDHRSQNLSLILEVNCLLLSVKVFIKSGKRELGKEKYLGICRIFLNFFSPSFSFSLFTWTHLFVPVFMNIRCNPGWQLQRNNSLVFVYCLNFF